MERGYSGNKDAVRKRLRRVEGQVRGLERMVDEDAYCIDVLTQISAIEAGGPDATEKVREAAAAIERLVKS